MLLTAEGRKKSMSLNRRSCRCPRPAMFSRWVYILPVAIRWTITCRVHSWELITIYIDEFVVEEVMVPLLTMTFRGSPASPCSWTGTGRWRGKGGARGWCGTRRTSVSPAAPAAGNIFSGRGSRSVDQDQPSSRKRLHGGWGSSKGYKYLIRFFVFFLN